MGWLTRTVQTSIGKKAVMAASGFLLGVFLIVHVAGNLTAFAGRQSFLAYSESLHSLGALITVLQIGLVLIFAAHVISAVVIYLDNLRARPDRYAVNKNAGKRDVGAMTMPYTGLLILCFLIVHLYNFRFSGSGQPIADLVRNTLNRPGYAFFYIVAVFGVALHVSHGFWSMFQTLGLNHPRYNGTIRNVALLLSACIGIVFILMPVLALYCREFLVL